MLRFLSSTANTLHIQPVPIIQHAFIAQELFRDFDICTVTLLLPTLSSPRLAKRLSYSYPSSRCTRRPFQLTLSGFSIPYMQTIRHLSPTHRPPCRAASMLKLAGATSTATVPNALSRRKGTPGGLLRLTVRRRDFLGSVYSSNGRDW
jgi:hypothetical protein